MFLFANNLGSWGVVAGILIVTMTLLRRGIRYRRTGKSTKRAENRRLAHATSSASHEMDRWEVHMHETARDLSAQLDSKMVALQHVIRLAEERSARLEELLIQLKAVSPTRSNLHDDEDAVSASEESRPSGAAGSG